jgi:hypothetical protein
MGGRVGVHAGLTHGSDPFILQIALYHIMSIRLRLSHSASHPKQFKMKQEI